MRLSRLLAVPVLLLCASASRADDTKEFLDPANWEGRSDIWTIKDGSIVGETMKDPGYNTFFCTKKKYSDFELSCKVHLRDGVGNSGFQVRSEVFDKEKFRVRGPQVDIGKGYWGSLYGEGVGGMMKASDPAKIKSVVKEAEWNDYHMLVKGTHYTIKINGETMVDADFPKLPPAKKGEEPKDAPTEGIIALQAHAGYPKMRVEFKEIKFTNLKK
jgi:hypothetical protein